MTPDKPKRVPDKKDNPITSFQKLLFDITCSGFKRNVAIFDKTEKNRR